MKYMMILNKLLVIISRFKIYVKSLIEIYYLKGNFPDIKFSSCITIKLETKKICHLLIQIFFIPYFLSVQIISL